ncbi:MAG TPA: histidine kinase [Gemmatimonadaceae bacterium]|nr:histidine kinase [Gemmatimonadaceae bacterium]
MKSSSARLLKNLLALAAGWSAFALLSSAHFFFAEGGNEGASFKELFRNIFAFYWVWAVLTPVVISIAQRYTSKRRITIRSVLILVLGGIGVTILHGILYLPLVQAFGMDGYKQLDANGFIAYLMRHGGGDLATYAVIVGVVFLVEERKRASEREAANAALQVRLARTDLELLRWQLHPHFLFNALNTVSTLVLQHETDRAERAISLISKYLRSALDQRPETTVRLSDELLGVERYIEIERMRFGNSIRFDAETTDAALSARIPSELIQPLVENAIVHGAVRDNGAEPIVLRTQVAGDRLRLSISNPTASAGSRGAGNGFGLRYVRERLSQFYGSDAHFNFDIEGSKAVATLDIPYTTEPRGIT